jgi:cytokinesis protein
MKEARRKAEQMQLYLTEMNRVYDDILTFFGDDNKDDNARRDFFGKLANFVNEYKKSNEKNLILEETWRRNEANMRRKQINVQAANASAVTGDQALLTPSPSSGAMDSLLEKLRAAAPQTRDTRDRRRRARLKDRHQVRVASGQQIPETGENVDETGLLSPTSQGGSETASERPGTADGEQENTATAAGSVSEGEDIADRAASLLQGLRGDEAGDGGVGSMGRDDSLRVRRRRESADEERQRRRAARRRTGNSSVDAGASGAPTEGTIAEEAEGDAKGPPEELTISSTSNGDADGDGKRTSSGNEQKLPTPTTVVVPPSPTQSERKFSLQHDGPAE